MKRNLEVRHLSNGELDEIVADGASVHLERMSPREWWLLVSIPGRQDLITLFFDSARKITIQSEYVTPQREDDDDTE